MIQDGKDWLIVVCYSKHWECPEYSEYFLNNLMFPLSDKLDQDIHLGHLDTYEWLGFESQFHIKSQPSLVLVRNGTHFYNYPSNLRKVKAIVEFVKRGYEKTDRFVIPEVLNEADVINYVVEALKLGFTVGPSRFMKELGLGGHHWTLQIGIVLGFITLQYMISLYLFKMPEAVVAQKLEEPVEKKKKKESHK